MNHRGTEKRNTEKKRREIAKEARKAGEEKADSASFLVPWLP
jgi:hypothetical protein